MELILSLFSSCCCWERSRRGRTAVHWGYAPTGGLGLVLLIVLILYLLHYI